MRKHYAVSYFKILSEEWLAEEAGFIFGFAEKMNEPLKTVFMEIGTKSFQELFQS